MALQSAAEITRSLHKENSFSSFSDPAEKAMNETSP